MAKKKIFAKTLNPEHFDWRVYQDEIDFPDTIIIDGGREYSDIDLKGYLKSIKQLNREYMTYDYNYYYEGSIKSFLLDMLPKKENGKHLSPVEIKHIKDALDSDDEEAIIATCLAVIFGKAYKKFVLRGCCQGEVVYLYAPEEIPHQEVDWYEAWYFGTGTEIEVDDSGAEEITKPEDIEGFTIYTALWKDIDIKHEILKQCNIKEQDYDQYEVVLWKFDGYVTYHIDQYKLAE